MVWHRLPSFLPNFTLKLLPLSEAQQKAFQATGFVRNVAFRTSPSASKVLWIQAAFRSAVLGPRLS
jgi:hypothetical protein